MMMMMNTKDQTRTNMPNKQFNKSYPYKYWLHFFQQIPVMWWWWWLSSSFFTYLVRSFSIWIYMYNSITTRSLIPSFFTSMLMVYIYMSHSSQRKMKQKKKMNISHLAHISISIFCRCRSLLFSVDAASYFLVGRHRLSFFVCPR
jgi:hypothetical protein